jgi:hypothetical protein
MFVAFASLMRCQLPFSAPLLLRALAHISYAVPTPPTRSSIATTERPSIEAMAEAKVVVALTVLDRDAVAEVPRRLIVFDGG